MNIFDDNDDDNDDYNDNRLLINPEALGAFGIYRHTHRQTESEFQPVLWMYDLSGGN